MAQTVNIRRGTTSITAGGSYSTIFTMSTGTAARIIPVMFTMYFTQPVNVAEANYFYIKVNSSAGGGQVLSMMPAINFSSSSMRSMQLNATGNNSGYSVQSKGTGDAQQATASLYANYSGYMVDNTTTTTTTAVSFTNQPISLPNFWMGSGDSVQLKVYNRYVSGKSNLSNTLQVAYSFVEIAES